MDKEKIVNQFYKIYHGTNQEIYERMKALLRDNFDPQNRHVKACLRFSKIISESPESGMLYGMLWNAFRELLKDTFGGSNG